MIRTLLIIAGAGLVLAIAGLGGAAAIGGHDLSRNGWSWTIDDRAGDGIRFERNDGPRPADAVRNIAWTGSDSIEARMPVDLTYRQGASAGIVVTGPQDLVDRVVAEGGVIRFDHRGDRSERVTFSLRDGDFEAWSDQDRLRVTVTAPGVNRFSLHGSGDLSIEGYDQDSLTIAVNGSSDVSAVGRVRALTLDVSGSGSADLERLVTTDAVVSISGSGEADIAPTGQARIDVSGSGDVTLHTRPADLVSKVSGSGSVRQRD